MNVAPSALFAEDEATIMTLVHILERQARKAGKKRG